MLGEALLIDVGSQAPFSRERSGHFAAAGLGAGRSLWKPGPDGPLFKALRAWRRERAAEQRVPPYVIFHDTTLSAIARERPASLDELAKASGVGQSKFKRYGADVMGAA